MPKAWPKERRGLKRSMRCDIHAHRNLIKIPYCNDRAAFVQTTRVFNSYVKSMLQGNNENRNERCEGRRDQDDAHLLRAEASVFGLDRLTRPPRDEYCQQFFPDSFGREDSHHGLYGDGEGVFQHGRKKCSKGKAPQLKFCIKPAPRLTACEEGQQAGNAFLKAQQLLPPVSAPKGKSKFVIKAAKRDAAVDDGDRTMGVNEGEGEKHRSLLHRLQQLTEEASTSRRDSLEPPYESRGVAEPPRTQTEEDIADFVVELQEDQVEANYAEVAESASPLLLQLKKGLISRAVPEGSAENGHLLRLPVTSFQAALHKVVEKEKRERAAACKTMSASDSFSGGCEILDVRIIRASLEAHITKCLCEVLRAPQEWVSSAAFPPTIFVLFPTRGHSDIEFTPNLSVRLLRPWREVQMASDSWQGRVVLCTTYAAVS